MFNKFKKKNKKSPDKFEPTIQECNTVGSIAEKNTKNLSIIDRADREKQIHDKDKEIMEERKRKLERCGYKNYEPNSTIKFIAELFKG